MKHKLAVLILLLGFLSVRQSLAQTGVVSWVSSASGLWRVAGNWVPGVPGTNDDYVFITNATTKAIQLDTPTPATNRVVKTFTLLAPVGSTNTLWVTGASPTDLMLEGQNDFNIGDRGHLVILNARVQVQEKNNGLFRVASGSVAITNGRLDLVADVRARIGAAGSGRLTFAGGTLNAGTNFSVGYDNASQGIMHVLNGAIDIQGQLRVAENEGSRGEVIVLGGELRATNAALSAAARIGNSGFGILALSNGVVNFDDTSVGRNNGATGIVHVAGGILNASTLSLGRFAGAFGRLLVSGGQLIQPDGSLWVGREGAGELVVSNGVVLTKALNVAASPDGFTIPEGTATLAGGSLVVLSNVLIGTAGVSSGKLTLNGGSLSVEAAVGPGDIQVQNGILTLNAGLIQAITVNLPSVEGQLQFRGGTLRTRDLTVANGAPFVVGDGINPAVLQMDGGVFSFSDGLIINPNATLIFCGQLNGNITQLGSIITNCPPRIVSLSRTGPAVAVDFIGMSGLNYLLEFKNTLGPGVWTPVQPPLPGSFGILTAMDYSATNFMRFYRIKVQ